MTTYTQRYAVWVTRAAHHAVPQGSEAFEGTLPLMGTLSLRA
jgi:hypothetical protein